jgi:hypothetical protein
VFAVPAFHNRLWFWTFNAQRTDPSDPLSWRHILGTASITTTNLVLSVIVLVAPGPSRASSSVLVAYSDQNGRSW